MKQATIFEAQIKSDKRETCWAAPWKNGFILAQFLIILKRSSSLHYHHLTRWPEKKGCMPLAAVTANGLAWCYERNVTNNIPFQHATIFSNIDVYLFSNMSTQDQAFMRKIQRIIGQAAQRGGCPLKCSESLTPDLPSLYIQREWSKRRQFKVSIDLWGNHSGRKALHEHFC